MGKREIEMRRYEGGVRLSSMLCLARFVACLFPFLPYLGQVFVLHDPESPINNGSTKEHGPPGVPAVPLACYRRGVLCHVGRAVDTVDCTVVTTEEGYKGGTKYCTGTGGEGLRRGAGLEDRTEVGEDD